MDRPATLAEDAVPFVQGEVTGIDADNRTVDQVPSESPGAAAASLCYCYLVIALGTRLAYDRTEGFGECGDTVSDFYHGKKLRRKLHDGTYQGGPIVIRSAMFHHSWHG